MALRRLLFLALVFVLALWAGALATARGQDGVRPVMLSEVAGVIGPPSAHQIERAIAEAEERDAEVLILQLNTPGGLETSMRDIIEGILDADIPVIGYVAPSGGRAASAGTYILYATHVAAMAPGTNVGAATPVQMSGGGQPAPQPASDDAGEESDDAQGSIASDPEPAPSTPLERKAVNDAAAFMRSLAELRGRNGEWGEQAVRGGVAISASEALELNVIDIVADDLDDLLAQIDGRTVTLSSGERVLETQGRTIERIAPGWVTEALGVLANPNVAFLLMMVGVYGLIFEFANPGSIGPGVVGVVALMLGLYALNLLPLNYAGFALIIVGIAFIVAEALTPTFGVLGVGGAIAFLIGAAMLIDTDIPAYQIHWSVIAAALVLSGAFILWAVGASLRAVTRKVATGREGLIGESVAVEQWSGSQGFVWAQGERWRALGPEGLAAGDKVRVEDVQSLTLRVSHAQKSKPERDAL